MYSISRRNFLASAAAGLLMMAKHGNLSGADERETPLYMLTYDHGGVIGWGPEHFLRNLRNAITWLEKYPSFKIGLDNEAYTYDYLSEVSPSILKELREYLAIYKGRFGIGTCTYGQPLSCFINEESNIRQIGYALETDRRLFGSAPDIYLMSEHAMHSQIPQIIRGFGFKGAIMRTHYMMYGYNPVFNAAIGWWTGIDGSRIPTIPTYEGEGAQFGKTTVDTWMLTRFPSEESRQSPDDFRRMFSHITPLLATRADDAHLRREELVRMYEGKPGFQWILLEELLSLFPDPELPLRTGPNDFTVRMPWGYCGNEIWDACRKAEVSVLTAERMNALASLIGGALYEDKLDAAWKNLLIAQHHDIQICGILEDSRKFLPVSIDASREVSEISLRFIAGEMQGGEAGQITVFNPNSWARREWIETEAHLPEKGYYSVRLEQNGKAVSSVLLAAARFPDGSIRDARIALLSDMPGLGIASYGVTPHTDPESTVPERILFSQGGNEISTPFYEISLHPNGGVSTIRERGTGKELLKPGRRSMYFEGIIEGKNRVSEGGWFIETPMPGAPWVKARETGMIGSIPYQFELTFRIDMPRIDCRATFRMEGQKVGRLSENRRDSVSPFIHEDKLRLKLFPNTGGNAVGIRDVPFGIAETNDRYVQGNYWTAESDGETGAAIFNKGAMGSVREEDGGFSVPLIYAMYYIWGTRMLNGDFSYEFSVYPFSGHWKEADIHRKALDYNFPLCSLSTGKGTGLRGHIFQPFGLQSENIILSALFTRNGSLYARIYEHEGKEGVVRLETAYHKSEFFETDLEGNQIGALPNKMTLAPWSFRTLRIECR